MGPRKSTDMRITALGRFTLERPQNSPECYLYTSMALHYYVDICVFIPEPCLASTYTGTTGVQGI